MYFGAFWNRLIHRVGDDVAVDGNGRGRGLIEMGSEAREHLFELLHKLSNCAGLDIHLGNAAGEAALP